MGERAPGPRAKQSGGKKSMWLCVWVGFGLCALAAAAPQDPGAAEPPCAAARSLFESRGLLTSADVQDAPNSDGGGLCSARGCCGAGARLRLPALARQHLEAALKTDLNKLSGVLATRAHRFDEFFKGLLLQSKQEFHEMFKRTYGMIYERHSYVFTDLFAELERYYERGDVDLVQVMDKFFVVLYQKMFTVLNSQYNFDEKYLQCVSEHMSEIQPFDDVPHKLSIQLRRAFVATRTFQKALQAGAEVAKNMNEIGVSAECAAAWARVRWCGACAGAAPPACSRLCINVVRGCAPLHADLAHHWDAYVDAVDKVSDRLLGPFNIAMVVQPIDIKISEAIMNFQEHSQEISQRIFTGCGKPVLGTLPASAPAGAFFSPKRDRRSVRPDRNQEVFTSESSEGSDGISDFEIEAPGSLLSKNKFFEQYDLDTMRDLAENAENRARFLEYMKGQINSNELDKLDGRFRRDADPAPAGKSSKEIDFEPYNFEGSPRGGKRKEKKPTGISKTVSSKESASEPGGGGGAALDRLVRESRARVRNSRKYWSHLPYVVCNDDVAAGPSPDLRCYNGTHLANYLPPLAGEGMTALATNPEVRAQPPGKGAVLLAAQESLRAITTKLKNAYNGLDVDWRDYAESRQDSASLYYGSGSGSGDAGDAEEDLPDDDEDRRNPYDDDDFPGSGHGPTSDRDEEEEPETRAPPRAEPPAPPDAPSVVGGPGNPRTVDMRPDGPPDYAPGPSTVERERPADSAPEREREPPEPPASGGMSLQRAAVSYLLPIVCAWFGGIVNDLV